jgi:hypothetical protein
MFLKNKILAVGFAAVFSLPFASYADSLITANVKNSTSSLITFEYERSQCAYNYERKILIPPGEIKKIIFNSDEGGRCGEEMTTHLSYKFYVNSANGGNGLVSIHVSDHTKFHFSQIRVSNVFTEIKTIEGIPTYIIYGG